MRIRTSESDPLDFCRRHVPCDVHAFERWGHLGDGPDGRGNCFTYDDDHPPYTDDTYRCHLCTAVLTEED